MSNTPLSQKNCRACAGEIDALQPEQANKFLTQLASVWSLNANGHLEATFQCKPFSKTVAFFNQVAILAEQQQHHPNFEISWGTCRLEIWTHKIQGLTESDFILAAKIDALSK